MGTHFLLIALLLVRLCSSYYLNPNVLLPLDAEQYCIILCNSHLASFHNTESYLDVIAIKNQTEYVTHNTDIIFGLIQNNDNTYYWLDGSPFNWGNDTSGGQFPWYQGRPNVETQIYHAFSTAWDWKWDDITSEARRSVCNDCIWTRINKYIIYDENDKLTFDSAQNECQSRFGTDLASIHSYNDFLEAQLLLQLFNVSLNNKDPMWIGLNDRDAEGIWKWIDGTTFDYAANITGGVYPWSTINGGQPNNLADEDCVQIGNGDQCDWRWCDQKCNNFRHYLCNLPSTLCTESNWQVYSGNWTFTGNSCNVINYNNNQRNVIYLESQYFIQRSEYKQWNRINIEYMYSLDDVYGGDINATGGLVIDLKNSLIVDDMHSFYVVIGSEIQIKYNDGSKTGTLLISTNFNTFSFNTFYRLSVLIDEYGLFNVSINEQLYLSYNVQFEGNIDIPLNYWIATVGMVNFGVNSQSKSLYFNGESVAMIITSEPTTNPTPNPSTNPSNNPTETPSNNPTRIPSNQPTLSPIVINTNNPTGIPSNNTSNNPTRTPSNQPTLSPIVIITNNPTGIPSNNPSNNPTLSPTVYSVETTITPSSEQQIKESTTLSVLSTKNSEAANDDGSGSVINTEIIVICACIIICVLLSVALLLVVYLKKLGKQVNTPHIVKGTSSISNHSMTDDNNIQEHANTAGGIDMNVMTIGLTATSPGGIDMNTTALANQIHNKDDNNRDDIDTDENEDDVEEMFGKHEVNTAGQTAQ